MTLSVTPPHITAQAQALCGSVAALQPDAIPASEAPALWSAFDRIERLAAAAKILLARRVEDSKVWQREGHRSAADFLAQRSGSSMAASRGALATSKRIVELAETETALRRAELSAAQVEAIADAAAHNPHEEHKLLETASHSRLAELRDECSRAKAAGDPDPDTTYRRIHENRYLRRRQDSEGAWNLTARGTPDAGALFNAALNPIIDEIFHSAWAEGRREERQNYAFDALLELARRARDGHNPQADNDGSDTDIDPDNAPVSGSSQLRSAARASSPAGTTTATSATATTTGPPTTPAATPRPHAAATLRGRQTKPPMRAAKQQEGGESAASPSGGPPAIPRIWRCCASTSKPSNAATPTATRPARSPESAPFPSLEPTNYSVMP